MTAESVPCRHCGTEIAGNALICYRCGAAVEELRAPTPARARSRVTLYGAVAVIVAAVLAALFLLID